MRFTHIPAAVTAAVLLCVLPARAHVMLDSPNGGEQLQAGSVFTVQWHILIAHPLQNWDLWYSTTGSSGPWTVIEMNVPAGSQSVGVPHFYDWTVPDVADDTVWIRVKMDNTGTDYEDVSDAPFAIIGGSPADVNQDGVVNVIDLTLVIIGWGSCEGGDCAADINGDDIVNVLDLIAVILAWG